MVESAVGDVEVRGVGQKVVPHQDAHEDEVVDYALQLELEGQLGERAGGKKNPVNFLVAVKTC